MKKILTLFLVVALVFTMSIGSASATLAGTAYSHANATVKAQVQAAINAYPEKSYSKTDYVSISNYIKELDVAVSNADITATETNLATVSDIIAKFKASASNIKTLAQQRTLLNAYKTTAKTNLAAKKEAFLFEVTKTYGASESLIKDFSDDAAKIYAMYAAAIDACVIMDAYTYPELKEEALLDDVERHIDGLVDNAFESYYNERLMPDNQAHLVEYATMRAETLTKLVAAGKYGITKKYNESSVNTMLADTKLMIAMLAITNYADVDEMFNTVEEAKDESVANLPKNQSSAVIEITTGAYTYTNWPTTSQSAILAIQNQYTTAIWNATSEEYVNFYVKQAKTAMDAYKTTEQITKEEAQAKKDAEEVKKLEEEKKAIEASNANLEAQLALEKAFNAIEVKCSTEKLAKKGTKVIATVSGLDAKALEGYKVTYKFQRFTNAACTKCDKTFVTSKTTYNNTNGKIGKKYYYKVTVILEAEDGTVMETKLGQCTARGIRTFR